MRIDVISLFPEFIAQCAAFGVTGRAAERGLLSLHGWNPRDYAEGNYRRVDDRPFGGGPGMVMLIDPLRASLKAARTADPAPSRTIYLSPQGAPLTQAKVRELAAHDRLVLLCGRYEGIDERVHRHLVTDEVSIGDFVLTGGEPAALVLIDAVARLIPGVLGKDESAASETFAEHLLEYPHYTRPPDFRGWTVPEVLTSGNHGAVDAWRREQSLWRTLKRRPDLFLQHELTSEDRKLLGLTPPKRKKRRRPEAP